MTGFVVQGHISVYRFCTYILYFLYCLFVEKQREREFFCVLEPTQINSLNASDFDSDLVVFFYVYVLSKSPGEVPALQCHSIPANSHNQLWHYDAQWFSFILCSFEAELLPAISCLALYCHCNAREEGSECEQRNECVHRQVRLTPLEFLQQRCAFIQRLTCVISQMLLSTFSSFFIRNCHFDPPSI